MVWGTGFGTNRRWASVALRVYVVAGPGVSRRLCTGRRKTTVRWEETRYRSLHYRTVTVRPAGDPRGTMFRQRIGIYVH